MPTLIITQDGRELQRVPLTQPRTTVGRRPYNDIVMEHLAVSGEHAVFVLQPDGRVQVLDLNSTNGTYVNGRAVVSADVGPGDVVEIARYQLRVETQAPASSTPADGCTPTETPDRVSPSTPPDDRHVPPAPAQAEVAPTLPPPARLEVVDGPAAGRALTLLKTATTIGKPGVAVAVVERTPRGYRLNQVAGEARALVNGEPLPAGGAVLHDGDMIALAGTRIRFLGAG